MGQGQIKKGFFFYFGLFVLFVIAVVLVCMVIMMFNPGQSILWMKYFTADQHMHISSTTGDNPVSFDIKNIKTIEINTTSFANVRVQNNNDEDFVKQGIYIINKAKGFAGHKSDTTFNFDVTLQGTDKLVIDIYEPEGFLYMSKEVEVVLTAYNRSGFPTLSFADKNLIINAHKGDIIIANDGTNTLPGQVNLNSIVANTVEGDIIIGRNFDTTTLNGASLTTTEGKIWSNRIFNVNGKSMDGIAANCNMKLGTGKGNIALDFVSAGTNTLAIECKTGIVDIDTMNANNVSVECKQGIYLFDNVNADLSFAASEDIMIAPNVKIGTLTGDFVLTGGAKAKPDLSIGIAMKDVYILADSGKVDINYAKGMVEILSEGGLSTDIIVAETNENKIQVVSKSGGIKLSFKGVVKNVVAKTNKAKIVLNVTNEANFTAVARENNPEVLDENAQAPLDEGKINVSIQLLDGTSKNPITPNGGTEGTVKVFTNGSVEYVLVAKSEIGA